MSDDNEMLKLADRLSKTDAYRFTMIGSQISAAERDLIVSALRAAAASLCEDCPPVGYPTDETRCAPCPRTAAAAASAEPVAWPRPSRVGLSEMPVGDVTDHEAAYDLFEALREATAHTWHEIAARHLAYHKKRVTTHSAPDAEIVAALELARAHIDGCDYDPEAIALVEHIDAALAKAKGGSRT